ncbi:MAG: hypothetical protein WBD41_02740 [Rhodococcus sp. (in: high G+C Gram-positive bacteria)]
MSSPRAHNPAARYIWCPQCGHRGYHTRTDAKAVRKRHRGKGMTIFTCPYLTAAGTTLFHLGHQPAALGQGRIDRGRVGQDRPVAGTPSTRPNHTRPVRPTPTTTAKVPTVTTRHDHDTTDDGDASGVDTNEVPLQPNPWTVTTTAEADTTRIVLAGHGVDFTIDRDLRFQLLDALRDATALHSPTLVSTEIEGQ